VNPEFKIRPFRRLFSFSSHMVLSQEEIDGCREAFLAFDKDNSHTIDVWELRQVLEAMGQKPTEEELFQMISEVDENMSGSIDFAEFLKVIENQKERAENFDDESDMIDAFVACGGQPDKTGNVKRDTLIKIIKTDFGLTIDIEELIDQIDSDRSGEIEYNEFKRLLS
jgi:Ca2+-binding EF-hand superfamily protein